MPKSLPLQEAADLIKDMINEMIDKFDESDGHSIEAWQENLQVILEEKGLLERGVMLQVDNVAPHPDNREKAMLVPSDAHVLLDILIDNGFILPRWEALACTMPPGELGRQWTSKVDALQKGAGGLVAEFALDRLSHLTARGSHGTSALRSAKFGGLGVNPDLCDCNGNLSLSTIYEKQPSLKAPIEKGVPYTVVAWQICAVCPRLMETFSRTGNASHNAFRQQTTLQHCNRIHNLVVNSPLKTKDGQPDWDRIAKQACISMGKDFENSAKQIGKFVKVWSGGVQGHILTDLEKYERILPVKRHIYPSDLEKLCGVPWSIVDRQVKLEKWVAFGARDGAGPPLPAREKIGTLTKQTTLAS